MDDKSLRIFYEKALLPQFGLKDTPVTWGPSQAIGPDETVHYFSVGAQKYALIFEDYDGHGRDPEFIREHITMYNPKYEFVEPIAAEDNPPSYHGLRPLAPYQYCHNVTGTFTLLKLAS